MLVDTKKSRFARVYSLAPGAARWDAGFWLDRFNTCADVTIPHILSVFDDIDSVFHQVENFRVAAGRSDGDFRGTPYGDGDFYKLMEGMTYAYALHGDEEAGRKLDAYIELIAAAQQPDGYISTKQIIGERKSNGTVRHGDVNDFEEYNFGHLFTSACIHKRLTGKDSFLQVAEKCAGYLERMYKKILGEGKAQTAVCPSHYMGLFELYRTTGEEKYLEMGKAAIKIRDLVTNGSDDNQDRIPMRQHRKIVGHAVRSTYLYAGVADLYLETGDEELLEVLNSCWDNLMEKKIYVTGGCGALYTGTSPFGHLLRAQYVHQAFGYEYQLPNVTAYNETCGTLGHIFWAHRMFMIDPQAKYLDLIERSYYNLVLAAVSLDGDKYFYENMLRRAKKLDYEVMWPVERKSVFSCFCCPTNLSRSIPQAVDYMYKVSDDAVWTGMYAAGTAEIRLENGAQFKLTQQTDYPWNGHIRLTVSESNGKAFAFKIRVPGWVQSGRISFAGSEYPLTGADADSFIELAVTDPAAQSAVEISFDMPARLLESHPMVEENTNQICVTRGPLVYCAESPDLDADTLDRLVVPSSCEFVEESCQIRGFDVVALRTQAAVLEYEDAHRAQTDSLYRPMRVKGLKSASLRLIPYFAWDNRGFGEMRIWMPVHYTYGMD